MLQTPSIHLVGRQPAVHHRRRGDIPGCVPAPHDTTLLEQLGLKKESCLGEVMVLFERYKAGHYPWESFINNLAVAGHTGH